MLVVTNRRKAPRGRKGSYRVNLVRWSVPDSYYNSIYWTWLNDAKNWFENAILGPNISLNVRVTFTDLGDSTLGSCGVGDGTATGNPLAFPLTAGCLDISGSNARSTLCRMQMSTRFFQLNPTEDYYRGYRAQFFTIAIHEIFHGVGFGTLWNGDYAYTAAVNVPLIGWVVTQMNQFPSPFMLYNDIGAGNPNTPRYTASRGRDAYREQMGNMSKPGELDTWVNTQAGAGSIPIENVGMGRYTLYSASGGTALSHWRITSSAGGVSCEDRKGRHINSELMTGYSGGDMMGEYGREEWVSRFTVQSLRDIGYTVDNSVTDIPLHYFKSVY